MCMFMLMYVVFEQKYADRQLFMIQGDCQRHRNEDLLSVWKYLKPGD